MPFPVFGSILLAIAVVFAECAAQGSGQAPATAQNAPGPAADVDLLEKQALEEGQAGKTDDAIRDYRRALEQRPEWKEGLWNLGMLQYGNNQFVEAKATFQRVVEFAPSMGIAWSLLGLSEFETGDLGAALAHLEKAQSLGIKDDDEIARVSSYHLAILWVHASEFERASDLLLATFGTGMASPQAKIALGLATLRVPLLPDQLDPSREALVQAAGKAEASGGEQQASFAALVRDHPELPYLHYAYGLALASAGKENEALEQILEETRISPGSAAPWIEMSRLELRHGAVDESLKAAQEAVRISPDDGDAHQALAQAWDGAGKAEQAAAERGFAAPANPAHPGAEQRIVLLYANARAGEKDQANRQANRERWSRAMQEYTAGQYSAASTDLKAWLAVTPESGTAWAILGLCEFELKDFDNALIHLDRGSKLGLSAGSESLSQAKYTFGVLLVHAGQFERAAGILSSVTDLSGPLAAKVEVALGLSLLRRAELPDAVSPSEAELVSAAGRIESLLFQSQYDKALPQLKLLLNRYPDSPFLHYAYGTALIALSQFDEAAAQMQAERSISLTSELPCVRLASIALRQHDSAAAITWSQRALQLAPNSVDAHYLLGRASLEAGDPASAIRELEVAARLSPASPEVHFNLAKAYARVKMTEKAQQERDIFSRLNEMEERRPGHDGSQVDLGPRDSADGMKAPPSDAPASPRLQ